MSLRAKATKGGGGEKPDIEAGSHPAVCVAVIDLGTQEAFRGKGEATEMKHQVYFAYEIPGVAGYGAGCLVLGRAFNFTLHEKSTMREYVEACRGKKLNDDEEVDFKRMLGANCLLKIEINDNGYPKLEGALPLVKGMEKKKASRTPYYWDLDQLKDGADLPAFPDWLPKHYGNTIAEVVEGSQELRGKARRQPAAVTADADEPDNDDEAPF